MAYPGNPPTTRWSYPPKRIPGIRGMWWLNGSAPECKSAVPGSHPASLQLGGTCKFLAGKEASRVGIVSVSIPQSGYTTSAIRIRIACGMLVRIFLAKLKQFFMEISANYLISFLLLFILYLLSIRK